MKKSIPREELQGYADQSNKKFPKFVSGVINTANRFGKGTAEENVGLMSDEFNEFCKTGNPLTLENWTKWYVAKHNDSIKKAATANYRKLKEIKKAVRGITKKDVEDWCEDLVITKSFNGLYLQRAILIDLAQETGKTFRESTREDEKHGIDGYVGDVAYSVKPISYRRMKHIKEEINAVMIYYKMNKDKLEYDVEE